jgi:site-specific DNA-cytosine methylase
LSQDTKEALEDETHILVNRILEQGVDGVIGGYPCQDTSNAAFAHTDAPGISGTRSGLFWAMADTVRMVGAKYWLVENVAALFQRNRNSDMGGILGSMASIGFDAEWDCVAASTVGAPHHRARAYILAHPRGLGWSRFFPVTLSRQREFDAWENVRRVEDVPERSALYESKLCRGNAGVAKRLHQIGNGNPPCIIRELTKGLK